MIDPDDAMVLIPTKRGLSVSTVHDLAYRCADPDYDDLDDLVTDAGLDSLLFVTPDTIAALVERVRAFNETGDLDAFWGRASRRSVDTPIPTDPPALPGR